MRDMTMKNDISVGAVLGIIIAASAAILATMTTIF